GQEGAGRWLRQLSRTNDLAEYLAARRRNDQFVHLVMNARTNLERIYGDTRDKDGKIKAAKAAPAPPERLSREKTSAFDALRRDYAQLKTQWNGYSGYDAWFGRELNNAQLN